MVFRDDQFLELGGLIFWCVSCFTSFIRRMGKYGGLNVCVPPNLYGKALTLNVRALRDRAISR